MITKQLSKDTKDTLAIAPTAGTAGVTDINGATLDMANWQGFQVTVIFGAIAGGADTSIRIEQSDNSNMSSGEFLAAPVVTVADNADNTAFVVDVFKPTKRYCRVVVGRGDENAAVTGAVYKQYGARTVAVPSPGAGVTALVDAVSPVAAA